MSVRKLTTGNGFVNAAPQVVADAPCVGSSLLKMKR